MWWWRFVTNTFSPFWRSVGPRCLRPCWSRPGPDWWWNDLWWGTMDMRSWPCCSPVSLATLAPSLSLELLLLYMLRHLNPPSRWVRCWCRSLCQSCWHRSHMPVSKVMSNSAWGSWSDSWSVLLLLSVSLRLISWWISIGSWSLGLVYLQSAWSLYLAHWLCHKLWEWGYDPDVYAIPLLTSLIDLTVQMMLASMFAILHLFLGRWTTLVARWGREPRLRTAWDDRFFWFWFFFLNVRNMLWFLFYHLADDNVHWPAWSLWVPFYHLLEL